MDAENSKETSPSYKALLASQERVFDKEGEAFGDQRRRKKSMMYNFFFVVRRMLFVFAVVYTEKPAFQIIICVFLT
jgi:hypothetical protein